MRIMRFLPVLLLASLPSVLWAEFSPGDVPAGSAWYFHADFDEMRTTEAGRHLYGWLQQEVFDELRDETGVDLDKEADRITASGSSDKNLIAVIEGNISQATQDKVLALGAASGAMDKLESGGSTYYFVKDDGSHDSYQGSGEGEAEYSMDSIGDGAYFSFAIKNKILVTTTEADMTRALANGGKGAAGGDPSASMLVLSAKRSLVQAGVVTSEFEDQIGWDSNIIRNAQQVALLVADAGDKFDIQAQLLSAEKEMAESLASIVRGLISLQVFNDELDPDIAAFLQSTSVDVDGAKLTIKVALDAAMAIAAMD